LLAFYFGRQARMMRFCINGENTPGAALFGFAGRRAMQFRIKTNQWGVF
jgi:hypothetical protein